MAPSYPTLKLVKCVLCWSKTLCNGMPARSAGGKARDFLLAPVNRAVPARTGRSNLQGWGEERSGLGQEEQAVGVMDGGRGNRGRWIEHGSRIGAASMCHILCPFLGLI